MKNKTSYGVLALIIIGLAIWFVYTLGKNIGPEKSEEIDPSQVLSFQACVDAGYPVSEQTPRQCQTPDGRIYAEEIIGNLNYVNATKDMIVVDTPKPNDVTGKEFTVVGKARGNWYFEASFPIEILDVNGKKLTTGIAQAEGDWMTTQFVPFKATIKVPEAYIGKATMILKKDNPSDLSENDASVSFDFTIEY